MSFFRLHARASRLAAALSIVAILCTAAILPASAQNGAPPLPPGVSSVTLRVKFVDGTVIPPGGPVFPAQIASWVKKVKAQFGQGKARLDTLRVKGKQRTGRDLPDLSLWYTITLKPGADAASIVQMLQAMPEVESANGAPLPVPPPTDDFSGYQGYLSSLQATDSWVYDAAGAGSNVTIYDVEYSWNTAHEDLSKAAAFPLLMDPGDTAVDPFASDLNIGNKHGTSVLGELIADNNSIGVTGMAYNATVRLVPAQTLAHDYNAAYAIILATLDGSPGDVILIEQQAWVCNSFPMQGPSEWDGSVWDAIRTATDNGFTVVEAAGNGHRDMWLGQNLDAPECKGWFKTSHDSGAIIVGAGQSDFNFQPRSRLGFSDYGKRVNVQAWGDSVTTTGYGNLYSNGTDENSDYTYDFSGTSSASPMVAATVANMQSLAIALRGEPLSPETVRQTLIATGAPQTGNTKEHIGPQVRAAAAIGAIALARPSGPSASPAYATGGVASLKWLGLKTFKDQYLVTVDNDSDFSSPEFTSATKSTSIKTTTLPFGDYFWKVAALDIDGGSFRVTPLKSPREGSAITTTIPKFAWAAIRGATQYIIEIDTDSSFTSPNLITGMPQKPVFTPPAPLDMGIWYWHIKASEGVTTDFSPASTFVRTMIASPADGASIASTTPKLAWKSSPGATGYEVKIADNPGLLSPGIYTTGATKLAPPLDYGRWFWDVRASSGVTTPETQVFSFEITALASPKDGAITLDTTPTFKWKRVSGANSYRIVVGTGWDNLTDEVQGILIDISDLTKTTYTPLNPLPPANTYYWQVITDSGKTMPAWTFVEP